MTSLDLALIGNSSVAALIDANGTIVWSCLPRFDSDAVFCALLREGRGADDYGFFEIELADFARAEQAYIAHTPILKTRLFDRHGGGIEITDLAPRFEQFGRLFCPVMLMRQVRPISGSPRIRMRVRPACEYGARRPAITWGSNHVRYVAPEMVLRATTDFSITAILEETFVLLREPVAIVLGPDETLQGSAAEVFRRFLDDTAAFWRAWVRNLGIPFEWQENIIRAAITLKLNAYEDTGAIVAAVSTSIPESRASGRNWDYRYCWLRDAYFVVNALNRMNATRPMERYLDYIINIATGADGRDLQPVYAISGKAGIEEREIASLPGYRGTGCAATSRWSASSSSSASARRSWSTNPTPARGSCAGQSASTLFPALCAGRGVTASRRSPRASGSRTARAPGERGPTRCIRPSARGPGTRSATASPPLLAAKTWTRACSSCTSSISCGPTTRASRPPLLRSRRTCAAGSSCFATARRTTSASRKTPSWSARSGTSTRCPRWGARRRPARCSRGYSPAAIVTGFCPSTSIRAAASCGEIFRRPTAWWA